MERKVFGPVPSRRLGKSLGVNNIPYKICTYSCIYCQVGKAIKMQVERQEFYEPEKLFDEVRKSLLSITNNKDYPDYITIVPDGEPTLDINLGSLIQKFNSLQLPVAVITNASLINLPDVQQDLLSADYVSVKADTFNIDTWKKINKPYKSLDLYEIISGLESFARQFQGKLVTETMLIEGVNDSYNELENTVRVIENFEPDIAYLAIPTRPPAYKNATASDAVIVNEAYHIFKNHLDNVELLTGYEGNAFASTGNFRDDILSITAVHPMREDAVTELMTKTGDQKNILDLLVADNLLEKISYSGYNYYLRKFKR
ncbi:MAG: radical SAM protein [Prolixibacteraceae bacterium]|jgi:wyosine [tRNA(Phe)-imidazoG37] synthetase (radical SAM superfamily)|nr:radical SAM protein [Prolixibacteraceae bacterium]